MATSKIKATYSLDTETVKLLDRLARNWGVSKSEALRRAIYRSATGVAQSNAPLAALDRMQRSLGLTKAGAETWAREARAMRRAGSRRRGF